MTRVSFLDGVGFAGTMLAADISLKLALVDGAIMGREILLDIPRWVAEYGQLHALDTSGWRYRSCSITTMVSGIPSSAEAESFAEWIRIRANLLTSILEPVEDRGWAVVICL